MKIALLFEYSTLNGGERSMLAVLDWIQRHDSPFEFAAIAPPTGRLADALRQRKIDLFGWSTLDDLDRKRSLEGIETSLCEIVSTIKPDLLHSNSLSMGRVTGRIATHLDLLTTSHLRDIIKLSNASIADLNCNQRLIAVSEATRRFHVEQGLDEKRMTVIHNGIDLEVFRPQEKSGTLTAELGLPLFVKTTRELHPVKLIATIGQIGLRKGQDILVAAAEPIVTNVPGAHFVFVGERTSQKEESIEFERAIRNGFESIGLSDRLHLLGHRDDVSTLLNEVDVLVHPANQEPFGRVLLEATASGVPIVATDVGGTREIIEDEITGFLVPPRDPKSLASAVIRVLGDDVGSIQLRQSARRKALKEFSISSAAERLSDIWKEALKNGGSAAFAGSF